MTAAPQVLCCACRACVDAALCLLVFCSPGLGYRYGRGKIYSDIAGAGWVWTGSALLLVKRNQTQSRDCMQSVSTTEWTRLSVATSPAQLDT